MTIRDYLRRRMMLVPPLTIGGSVACSVLLYFWQGGRYTHTERDTWLSLGVMGVVAVVTGVQFLSQSRLRCPLCHQSLSKIALLFAWDQGQAARLSPLWPEPRPSYARIGRAGLKRTYQAYQIVFDHERTLSGKRRLPGTAIP